MCLALQLRDIYNITAGFCKMNSLTFVHFYTNLYDFLRLGTSWCNRIQMKKKNKDEQVKIMSFER